MSKANLCSLPTEVLHKVMGYLPNRDAVKLSQVCTDLRRITEIQSFWRKKAIRKCKGLNNVYKYNTNWFKIFVAKPGFDSFCLRELKNLAYSSTIFGVSDRHFARFTTKAEELNGVGYYYLISFLRKLSIVKSSKRHTLRNQKYGVKVYEFLSQYHLKKKWNDYCKDSLYLTPERAAAFYIEFIRPALGCHELFEETQFQSILKNVERSLPSSHPFHDVSKKTKESWKEKLHINNAFDSATCRKLISLISEELLSIIHLNSLTPKNDKLTLLNAFRDQHNMQSMNCLYVFIYFEAVLRRFGVKCDITSSNDGKFQLIWRENWATNSQLYTVDFENDFVNLNMVPADEDKINSYSPDKILLHLADKTKRMIKPSYQKKAWELLHFLQPNNLQHILGLSKIYRVFNSDLSTITDAFEAVINGTGSDIDNEIFQLHKTEIKVARKSEQNATKYRLDNQKFFVGQICYFAGNRLEGVICGWTKIIDPNNCYTNINHPEADQLVPYYQILFTDGQTQSVREDYLYAAVTTERKREIEYLLATEFIYFNGHCYIPCAEKDEEYHADVAFRKELLRAVFISERGVPAKAEQTIVLSVNTPGNERIYWQ